MSFITKTIPKYFDSIFVYHHQGLGDHLDCNGMVRTLLSEHDADFVYVFAKGNYFSMVEYMYRDEPKIRVIEIDKFNEKNDMIGKYLQLTDGGDINSPLLVVGHEYYPYNQEQMLKMGCAEIFYAQIGMDFKKRHDNFYIEREPKEEWRVYDKLNLYHEPYIFVHDDPARGFVISREKLEQYTNSNTIKIIKNDITENIFHFYKILENAQQIHCMESSFRSVMESIEITDKNYIHDFRGFSSHLFGSSKNNWKVVDYEETKPTLL